MEMTLMSDFTLEDLLKINSFEARGSVARIDKNIFYELVNEEIIHWIVWAERHKDMLCNNDENSISFNLITQLEGHFRHCFEISHDNHHGGHVDILVKCRRFYWLGEAKLSSGPTYSLKGFQQLVDRYSSGSPTCSEGGLFIYIVNGSARNKTAVNVLNEWKRKIEDESGDEISDLKFLEPHPDRLGLNLKTQHTHRTSGLPYTVHHYLVQLQHFPTDNQ